MSERGVGANALKFIPRLLVCVVVGLMLVVAPSEMTGAGNLRLDPLVKQPVDLPKAKYFAASTCQRCHGRKLEESLEGEETRDYVLRNEHIVWSTQDRHSMAFTVLDAPLGRQMGKLLNLDVTSSPACLACHGPDPGAGQSPLHRQGVSCESCHGPSGGIEGKEGWALAHTFAAWREKTPAQKREMGMNDMRSPVSQAETCLSCHVGDPRLGRLVTHEMYAAGHPPLPPVELAAFTEAEPKHWRYLIEKPKPIQEAAKFDPGSNERVKLGVVGGVVAFKKSLEVIAAVAEVRPLDDANSQKAAGDRWPEFALYDCYACHHELAYPGWRQARGFPGPPGRVKPFLWTADAVRFALAALSAPEQEFEEFSKAIDRLNQTFNQVPYGDPSQAAAAVAPLLKFTQAVIDRLALARFDRATNLSLVNRLLATATDQPLDPDRARFLGSLLLVIIRDGGLFEGNQAPPAELAANLKDFSAMLDLGIEPGKKPLAPDVPQRLKRIADYDPQAVAKLYRRIGALLPRG